MPAVPFKVKALFAYTSPHEDDLYFPEGQIITVTEAEDEDWYTGEYVDASGAKQEGIFPRNFVEEFIPVAPARPSRPARPKKEPEAEVAAPAEEQHVQEPEPEEIPEPEPVVEETPQAVEEPPAPEPKPALPPKAQPVPEKKPAPPPASEKPSSFRDRIAAFNKGSSAPPPPPVKPGGLGGSSYMIKKPFVAPPPSRNAYVPPPKQDIPTKIYRREEDPEIAARASQDLENAERAGLVPTGDDGEDQPKPTTLKERIALLQKQQAEQASRHTDAVQKKEKPKRPVKKRTDSIDPSQEEPMLEKVDSADTAGKKSLDSNRDEVARPRRKSSSRPEARKSFSDGNEAEMSGAGDTTEDPEELPVRTRASISRAPTREPDVGEEEGAVDEDSALIEDAEEEDEVDPEIRRKEEIRARMAKMSGGMGMAGMFGMSMPGPPPVKKKKPSPSSERRPSEEHSREERAPPVPMMGLPGMSLPGMARVRSPESTEPPAYVEPSSGGNPGLRNSTHHPDDVPDVEDINPRSPTGPAPPIPAGRPAPPPVPTEARPVAIMSPSAGSVSDDELSDIPERVKTPTGEASSPPKRSLPPPIPLGSPTRLSRQAEGLVSPRSAAFKRTSYFGSEGTPTSPTSPRRRIPPVPTPGGAPPQSRAPLPPPPTLPPLSRSSTGDTRDLPTPQLVPRQSNDDEITEYEGDYDTDIAPDAPHKDALKAHAREPSSDANSIQKSPSFPPPVPGSAAPRAVPPPPPSQAPLNTRSSVDMPRSAPPPAPYATRSSVDMPRGAPPPPPAHLQPAFNEEDDEYDPFKYTSPPATSTRQPAIKSPITLPPQPPPEQHVEEDEDDIYGTSPQRSNFAHYISDRSAAAPPPREAGLGAPPSRKTPRQSMDYNRVQSGSRRSTDMGRMSMDFGYIANDVALAEGTLWWSAPKGLPPAFQGRRDILFEFKETSSSSSRASPATISKELFVLFQDYSQTIITVRFNPRDPKDAKLEQRHELPPKNLRADQLEQASERFGSRIIEAVATKQGTVVGSGTPESLIHELLKPFPDALLPVGTRAYGALIYSNLGNAATQQVDEIRPGDIITLRNAVLKGKHGSMHTKYEKEVGRGEGHVGVVAEWDGTKKKVRAWEQGRESKKCKVESFKLDDLRSGEVKIWRVMARSWVGWERK